MLVGHIPGLSGFLLGIFLAVLPVPCIQVEQVSTIIC